MKLFSKLIFHILFGSSELLLPKPRPSDLSLHVILVDVPGMQESEVLSSWMGNDDPLPHKNAYFKVL